MIKSWEFLLPTHHPKVLGIPFIYTAPKAISCGFWLLACGLSQTHGHISSSVNINEAHILLFSLSEGDSLSWRNMECVICRSLLTLSYAHEMMMQSCSTRSTDLNLRKTTLRWRILPVPVVLLLLDFSLQLTGTHVKLLMLLVLQWSLKHLVN